MTRQGTFFGEKDILAHALQAKMCQIECKLEYKLIKK